MVDQDGAVYTSVYTAPNSALRPQVRHLPLPCVSAAFVAKTLPLPCVSAAFVAKTLPLPCVSAAFVAKTVRYVRG